MIKKRYKLGELYCGPGGLALGAKMAWTINNGIEYSIEHAWANDIDKDSCDTYKNNIHHDLSEKAKEKRVVCEDVSKFINQQLKKIQGFAYGFPCNDFSIVGEQNGFDGKFGGLYSYGVKLIDRFNPDFFIAENVGGIRSANEGNAFQQILSELKSAGKGYMLSAHLYKAEEYGIPQTRHRIIIVGIRSTLKKTFKVPAPTHIPENYKTVRSELIDKPIPKWAQNVEPTRQSPTVIKRLEKIKPGQNAWTADLPPELRLNVKGAKMSQIYRRLHPDKPAYTITGSGGGGTHVYHWKEPRALTNRERARLQTFPDDYVFKGTKESVRKQIGMAVPPALSKIIFTALLKTLAGTKYPNIGRGNIDIPSDEV